MGIRYIQSAASLLDAPATIPDALRKQADAPRRAMPLSRLVGNGMEYSDALALHSMALSGIAWADAAEWLGEQNLKRAETAEQKGSSSTARAYYRYASACFRFGQSAFTYDDGRKRALHARSCEAFAAGARLDSPPTEKIEIPYGGATLSGWLMRPPCRKQASVVIIFGGADGCREEYHLGALYLIERGMAALLLDGPGQGETRLRHGLHLTADVEQAFSAAADFLLADSRLGARIGIWGNSMGGTFAARTAAASPRIAACCVNGGSATPTEILLRFPRFIERLRALTGEANPERARAIIERLHLSADDNHIRCPLLVLHGARDEVFLIEGARQIYENAPSVDKEFIIWADGDHCIYNHSHEKHCIIADWFRERLT